MLTRSLLLAITALSISACTLLPQAHRPEITQGNVIEQKSIDQLRLGMTQEQVQFLMGTPALQDIFHPNRWDYIHYIDKQNEPLVRKQIALFFKDNALNKVTSQQFDITHLQGQAPLVIAKTPSKDADNTGDANALGVIPTESINSANIAAATAPIKEEVEKIVKATPNPIELASNTINQWQQAWSNQDVDTYIDSYITGYRTSKLSNTAWKKQRKQRLTKPSSIELTLDDIKITPVSDDVIKAVFKQSYKASNYKDTVLKELRLKKQDDQWKISKEKTLKKLR